MSAYSWPAYGLEAGTRAREAWDTACQVLPVGTPMTGEVIGVPALRRLPDHRRRPEATGLAEITTMPREAVLPQLGARVRGKVIWHADHNHQVKIKLDGRGTET